MVGLKVQELFALTVNSFAVSVSCWKYFYNKKDNLLVTGWLTWLGAPAVVLTPASVQAETASRTRRPNMYFISADRQYYPFTFTSLFQTWSRNCGAPWGTQSSSAEHKVNFFHLSLWHWGPPLPDMWPFQENKNRVEVFTVDIAVDWAALELCHQVFALCEHIVVVLPEPPSTTNAIDITSRTPATITAL